MPFWKLVVKRLIVAGWRPLLTVEMLGAPNDLWYDAGVGGAMGRDVGRRQNQGAVGPNPKT